MRAAAILGPGNVSKSLARFQRLTGAEWTSLIEQADIAVLFGGDGTVHRHLATLVELETPLLVVPCGSGNDFARALGIRRIDDSIAAFRGYEADQKNVRSIDLGLICSEAKQHYFCCVAGVGIDTQIARRANQLPAWLRARGGYALCAPREFLRFSPVAMRIGVNGSASSALSTLQASVANAPAYGGGMRIAPHARLDDGKLDVCVVRAMPRAKLLSVFPTVYAGRHLNFKEVEYSQTDSVRISTESPMDVYADGEYVCKTPVSFGVAPGALKVIVPPNRD